MKNKVRNLIIVVILLLNIGCDQITKNVARNKITTGENITVIEGYFTLTKVENTGAFLSMGNNLPVFLKVLLLNVLPALFLAGMLIYILRKREVKLIIAIPFAFIIGGGLGNLYDRILHGSVTDFLFMDFQIFRTGIFNLADVSIMVGVFWLIAITLHPKFSLKEM